MVTTSGQVSMRGNLLEARAERHSAKFGRHVPGQPMVRSKCSINIPIIAIAAQGAAHIMQLRLILASVCILALSSAPDATLAMTKISQA